MENNDEQQLSSISNATNDARQTSEEHNLENIPIPNNKSEELLKKNTKQHRALKFAAIVVSSIIGVLFIGYIIFLLSTTGSLGYFGQPFWVENGHIFFGPSSCSDENTRLRCSVTGDPYSWCSCVKRMYYDGREIIPVDKPIIYLYPESTLDLKVTLGNPDLLTSSYPKYTNGWNVVAYPNGDLIDKTSGKKLYALYWEGQRTVDTLNKTKGFVVKGEDSVEFLEDKLTTLGLNYKEAEEFIVYWLPKLESNKFNHIYFATKEEIDEEMPLELSVEPDTLIRIRMIFKGLDEYKAVEEQELTPAPERKGFTVVEWGGSELKSN